MQNSVIKNATEKLKCNSIYDFGEQQQQQKKKPESRNRGTNNALVN